MCYDSEDAFYPSGDRACRPGRAAGRLLGRHDNRARGGPVVARREDAAGALADAGLEVLDSAAYRAFRHRVDQAITRDILIARKPEGPLTATGSAG